MTSEATKAAKARYDAKTARYFSLKLNQNTDGAMIEHLEKQENLQGYLKDLIRKDMTGATTTDRQEEAFNATMNLFRVLRK